MTVIRVENLAMQYRNGVNALKGLSLTVGKGEIFSLLGQNGAGKSTLIHILTTYLRPTSGTVEMFGNNIYGDAAAIRTKVACVAQKTSIDTYLSLTENMMFQSRLYKIPKDEAEERMNHLISCFSLERYLKYPVVSYSGGVKRRLDIALNMMSRPEILFLDEPTVGMDIQSRRAMWDMMKTIRESFGTTIFLTTHYLEEADNLSDAICIMKDGRDVVQGTPDELRDILRQDLLKITLDDRNAAQKAAERLNLVFAERTAEVREECVLIPVVNRQEDLTRAAKTMLEGQVGFTGIEVMRPTIEDIFLRLTGGEEMPE